MAKNMVEVEGTVKEDFPGACFRVEIDGTKHEARCTIAGKLRKYRIRLIPGDRVKVELSPEDLKTGRIVYRFRNVKNAPLPNFKK